MKAMLYAGALLAYQMTFAASPSQTTGAESEVRLSGDSTSIFVAVRPWLTSWEVPLVDMQVVIPNPLLPVPVVRQSSVHAPSASAVVPLTVLGLRHKDFTVSTSISPKASYSTSGMARADTTRQEVDFNLGYSLTPNLLATIVYKSAKVDGLLTSNAEATLGSADSAKIRGLLVGLGASVPLQGALSLYGNVAYGIARQRLQGLSDATGRTKHDADYTIGEIGLAYRFYEQSSGLKSATLQVGYRAQSYRVKDLAYGTYSFPAGVLISAERRDVDSFTGGFILGLVGVF